MYQKCSCSKVVKWRAFAERCCRFDSHRLQLDFFFRFQKKKNNENVLMWDSNPGFQDLEARSPIVKLTRLV